MFRGIQSSKMEDTQFGVGSTITGCAGNSERWLVISVTPGYAGLLNLSSMCVVVDKVKVEDINFMTQAEVRTLSGHTDTNNAFSDFTFDPKGLKGI